MSHDEHKEGVPKFQQKKHLSLHSKMSDLIFGVQKILKKKRNDRKRGCKTMLGWGGVEM